MLATTAPSPLARSSADGEPSHLLDPSQPGTATFKGSLKPASLGAPLQLHRPAINKDESSEASEGPDSSDSPAGLVLAKSSPLVSQLSNGQALEDDRSDQLALPVLASAQPHHISPPVAESEDHLSAELYHGHPFQSHNYLGVHSAGAWDHSCHSQNHNLDFSAMDYGPNGIYPTLDFTEPSELAYDPSTMALYHTNADHADHLIDYPEAYNTSLSHICSTPSAVSGLYPHSYRTAASSLPSQVHYGDFKSSFLITGHKAGYGASALAVTTPLAKRSRGRPCRIQVTKTSQTASAPQSLPDTPLLGSPTDSILATPDSTPAFQWGSSSGLPLTQKLQPFSTPMREPYQPFGSHFPPSLRTTPAKRAAAHEPGLKSRLAPVSGSQAVTRHGANKKLKVVPLYTEANSQNPIALAAEATSPPDSFQSPYEMAGHDYGSSPVEHSSRSASGLAKGLRHFSRLVAEKVQSKGITTYNEVAEELVDDFERQNGHNCDQKNIRRRVYDALNVLMALDIISKEHREIKWVGLPGGPRTNVPRDIGAIKKRIQDLRDKIVAEEVQITKNMKNKMRLEALIQQNAARQSQLKEPRQPIHLPFVMVQCPRTTDVLVEVSDQKDEYCLTFSESFIIREDCEIVGSLVDAHLGQGSGGLIGESLISDPTYSLTPVLEQPFHQESVALNLLDLNNYTTTPCAVVGSNAAELWGFGVGSSDQLPATSVWSGSCPAPADALAFNSVGMISSPLGDSIQAASTLHSMLSNIKADPDDAATQAQTYPTEATELIAAAEHDAATANLPPAPTPAPVAKANQPSPTSETGLFTQHCSRRVDTDPNLTLAPAWSRSRHSSLTLTREVGDGLSADPNMMFCEVGPPSSSRDPMAAFQNPEIKAHGSISSSEASSSAAVEAACDESLFMAYMAPVELLGADMVSESIE
ncbi:uncharacterized protein BJ171DRAFT_585972 [Polychytrium aggregatum]|uniref:uncharacterized protein n=1 Tax=Polychytrium aggregatum TaxID=110093 RepID=UPI0022FE9BD6|nr:uncharacterized protein BJ171DRAFT_585972 [Polychytrium aggregatum]KAI9197179.1 hypothetical protein BJ171DRAFT_585972 [Polychytrium aggregatum]